MKTKRVLDLADAELMLVAATERASQEKCVEAGLQALAAHHNQ